MKNFFKNSDLKKRTSLPRDFPGRLSGARRAHMSQNYFSTKEQYLDFQNPKGKYQKIFIFFVRIFYACMHAPMPPMHAPPIGGMEPVF